MNQICEIPYKNFLKTGYQLYERRNPKTLQKILPNLCKLLEYWTKIAQIVEWPIDIGIILQLLFRIVWMLCKEPDQFG